MVSYKQVLKACFPLFLRIVRIGDFYDIPTSGILTTSGNTSETFSTNTVSTKKEMICDTESIIIYVDLS